MDFTVVTGLFTQVTSMMTSVISLIFGNVYTATVGGVVIASPVIGLSIGLIKRLRGGSSSGKKARKR